MKPLEWIFEHPQIVLFVGAAVFFWIKERIFGAKKVKDTDGEQWPGDAGEVVDWGEPSRPSRRPPTLPPPLTRVVVQEVREDQAAQVLKHQMELQQRLAKIRASQQQQAAKPAAAPKKPAAVAARADSYRARLRNPAELRRTLVMKEILDPPVSLR